MHDEKDSKDEQVIPSAMRAKWEWRSGVTEQFRKLHDVGQPADPYFFDYSLGKERFRSLNNLTSQD